jgi:hypothetical protein
MRRNAKEVKVIHRWRADEFDGEIPIGGDEEMLGTAMKVASQVNGIRDTAGEVIEIAAPYAKNAVWLNAHILAPFAGTNGAYKLGTLANGGDDYSWRIEAGKIAYGIGSVIVNVVVNGKYNSFGTTLRGVATMVGSGLLGARGAKNNFIQKTQARNRIVDPFGLSDRTYVNAAIGCYTVAGISYAYKKLMGGR